MFRRGNPGGDQAVIPGMVQRVAARPLVLALLTGTCASLSTPVPSGSPTAPVPPVLPTRTAVRDARLHRRLCEEADGSELTPDPPYRSRSGFRTLSRGNSETWVSRSYPSKTAIGGVPPILGSVLPR
jgi:hypothetical protein